MKTLSRRDALKLAVASIGSISLYALRELFIPIWLKPKFAETGFPPFGFDENGEILPPKGYPSYPAPPMRPISEDNSVTKLEGIGMTINTVGTSLDLNGLKTAIVKNTMINTAASILNDLVTTGGLNPQAWNEQRRTSFVTNETDGYSLNLTVFACDTTNSQPISLLPTATTVIPETASADSLPTDRRAQASSKKRLIGEKIGLDAIVDLSRVYNGVPTAYIPNISPTDATLAALVAQLGEIYCYDLLGKVAYQTYNPANEDPIAKALLTEDFTSLHKKFAPNLSDSQFDLQPYSATNPYNPYNDETVTVGIAQYANLWQLAYLQNVWQQETDQQ